MLEEHLHLPNKLYQQMDAWTWLDRHGRIRRAEGGDIGREVDARSVEEMMRLARVRSGFVGEPDDREGESSITMYSGPRVCQNVALTRVHAASRLPSATSDADRDMGAWIDTVARRLATVSGATAECESACLGAACSAVLSVAGSRERVAGPCGTGRSCPWRSHRSRSKALRRWVMLQ